MVESTYKVDDGRIYVPLPVVGGYLGYVGSFCLAAGIGLGAGVNVNYISFTRDRQVLPL